MGIYNERIKLKTQIASLEKDVRDMMDESQLSAFKKRYCVLLLEDIISLSKELTEISVLSTPIISGITITQLAKEALEVYEN